jgi:hypothetical protein
MLSAHRLSAAFASSGAPLLAILPNSTGEYHSAPSIHCPTAAAITGIKLTIKTSANLTLHLEQHTAYNA